MENNATVGVCVCLVLFVFSGLPPSACAESWARVAGGTMKAQKSTAFLYPENESSQRDIGKTIPFAVTSQRIDD